MGAQAAGDRCARSGRRFHLRAARARAGVLYFNPGSAGPRRFKLGVSIGRLIVKNGNVRGELVSLDV